MELTNLLNQVVFWLLPGVISRKIYIKLVGKRGTKEWEDFLEILLFSMINYLIYGLYASTVVKYSASLALSDQLQVGVVASYLQKTVWALCIVFLQPLGLVSLLAFVLYKWRFQKASVDLAAKWKRWVLTAVNVFFVGWVVFLLVRVVLIVEEVAFFSRSIKFFQLSNGIDWREIAWASVIAVATPFGAALIHTDKVFNRIGQSLGVTKHYGDEDVWDFIHNSATEEWVHVHDHKLGLVYSGWISVFSDSGGKRELFMENVEVFKQGVHVDTIDRMYLCREEYDLTIYFWKNAGSAEQAESNTVRKDEQHE